MVMAQTGKKSSGKGKVIAAIGAAVVGAAATFLSKKSNRKAVAKKAGELKDKAGKALQDAKEVAGKVQKESKKAVKTMKEFGDDLQHSAKKVKKVAAKEGKKVTSSARSKASAVKKSVKKATK